MGRTEQLSPQTPWTHCKLVSGTSYPQVQLSSGEAGGSPTPWAGFGNADNKSSPRCSRTRPTLHDMTGGSPARPHLCWGMLAHATLLTGGPVRAERAVLAPGFAEPAAALGVRGLLAMQQILADVVSDGLPADIQVDFILLQGICE